MRDIYSIMWCTHCVEYVEAVRHLDHDYIDCSYCGKIFQFPINDKAHKSDRLIGKPKKNQSLRGKAADFGSLSDIDDLETQAAKKPKVATAAKCTCQAKLANGFDELLSAQELAKLTAAALAKFRKEKKHKHLTDNRSSTSTIAHGHDLKRKPFSSRINYEALKSFYKDNAKKQCATSEDEECEDDELKTIEETHKEYEESVVNNAKDLIDVDGDSDDDDRYGDHIDDY